MPRRAIKPKETPTTPSSLIEVNDAITELYNPLQNYGGRGDPNKAFAFNSYLDDDLDSFKDLYKSSTLCQRIIFSIIKDSLKTFVGLDATGDNVVDDSLAYKWLTEAKIIRRIEELFGTARLFGNGYLVISKLGESETDLAKPLTKIKSIDLIELNIYNSNCCETDCDKTTYRDRYYKINPNGYVKTGKFLSVHGSRVYHAKGIDYFFQECGGSVVGGDVRLKIIAYENALNAASSLLQRHSVFLFQVANLAEKAITKRLHDNIVQRLNLINMGLSINNSVLIDGNEKGEFISQTYSGFVDVLEKIVEALVAVTGLPFHKLLGTSKGSAFSESGLSDRYHWADSVATFCDAELKPLIEWLLAYLELVPGYSGSVDLNPVFETALQLTEEEESSRKHQNAQTDEIYLRNKVLAENEIRESRFAGEEYGNRIILDTSIKGNKDLTSQTEMPSQASETSGMMKDTPQENQIA